MEATNPQAGVEQAPDIEAALETQFGFGEVEPKPKVEPPQEAQQESLTDPVSEEVTADDLPEVTDDAPAQSADDAFEIVHNGTQHKLSREDAIRYAQQGFDYTQKTQAVAEKDRQVSQRLQRVQEMEQLQQALAPDLAQVKAVEAQLAQYQKVDWVQLATDNPLEYPKYRAQYDQLMHAYQSARGQFEQKASAVQQQKQQLTAEHVQQQRGVLLDKLPAWKDPAKYEAGARKVQEYLAREGVPADKIANLTDAISVSIAYKAALYDELQRAKADKVKQLRTASPVVKPGAVSQQPDGKTEFRKFTQDFRKAGQKGNSRVQESLLEQRLSRTFKV